MIKFVKTRNFKKLEDFYADIVNGSNIVCGDNGKGKSTIFNAIRFCLYGASAVGCSRDLIPTFGTKNCEVVVGIGDIVVRRDMKNCTITKDGETVAEGNTPCTRYVEDYLGMDFKAFNIFCLSPQGETQALLTIGATELNRRVESYSGITLIDNMLKAISDDTSKLKGKLEGRVITDTAPLHEALVASKEYLIELTSELKKVTEVLRLRHSESEELSGYLAKATKSNNQIKLAQELHSHAKADRDGVEQDLAQAETSLCNTDANERDIVEITDKISEINAHTLVIKRRIKGNDLLNADIVSTEARIKELEILSKKEDESQLHYDHLQIELEHKTRLRDAALEDALTVKQHLDNDKKLLKDGVCPECKRPYDGFSKEEVIERIATNGRQHQSYLDSIKTLESSINLFKVQERTVLKDIKNYAQELSNAKNRLASLLEDHSGMSCSDPSELDELSDQRDDLVAKRQKVASNIEANENLEKTIEKLQRRYERLSRKMSEQADFAFSQIIDVSEQTERYEIVLADLKPMTTSELSLTAKKVGHESDLQHMEDELNHIHIENKEVSEAAKELNLLIDLAKLLRTKRQECMKGVWDSILIHASNFVMNTTGGWITGVGRDAKGGFTFSEEGRPLAPIDGVASGAQAAFCGTAIRVGMSQALHGKNSIIMMDEPTASMSEDNSLKLSSGLMSLGGQTILITHRKSESVTAQQVIEI